MIAKEDDTQSQEGPEDLEPLGWGVAGMAQGPPPPPSPASLAEAHGMEGTLPSDRKRPMEGQPGCSCLPERTLPHSALPFPPQTVTKKKGKPICAPRGRRQHQSGSLLAFPRAAVSRPKRALGSEQPSPWVWPLVE